MDEQARSPRRIRVTVEVPEEVTDAVVKTLASVRKAVPNGLGTLSAVLLVLQIILALISLVQVVGIPVV